MSGEKCVEDASLDDKIGRKTRGIQKFRQQLVENRRNADDPHRMAGLKVIFT
jgi:hypothetical protein